MAKDAIITDGIYHIGLSHTPPGKFDFFIGEYSWLEAEATSDGSHVFKVMYKEIKASVDKAIENGKLYKGADIYIYLV